MRGMSAKAYGLLYFCTIPNFVLINKLFEKVIYYLLLKYMAWIRHSKIIDVYKKFPVDKRNFVIEYFKDYGGLKIRFLKHTCHNWMTFSLKPTRKNFQSRIYESQSI